MLSAAARGSYDVSVSRISRVSVGAKRLLVGRPFRSDTIGATRLRKRIALPVFASDALSSVAYAPQEIFLVLSIAGMAANIGSAIPFVQSHAVFFAVLAIAGLAAVNLRGIRESGAMFAVPVYAFLASMIALIVWGLLQVEVLGRDLSAESAEFGLIALARRLGVRIAENPATQLVGAPEGYQQKTMIAQLAEPVFAGLPIVFYVVMVVTATILVLAANTAFNGFPVLASVLARDKYLPRQLATRGDRLAFSNGIVLLAIAAIALVIAFDAQVTVLIQLYIVGVFVAFTLGQLGMVRHWTRRLQREEIPAVRRRARRSRAVNAVGFALTSGVLIIVMATKFFSGAYIAVLAMVAVFGVMRLIHRHYDAVARELDDSSREVVLPSRTHCLVLVSKLHLPTMRALAYARATRPDTIEALTVNIDTAETRALVREWESRSISVPLKVVESPYREINRPVVDYVKRLRDQSPRDVVIVYIPEYVVGHWWEQLLHNQSALRLKTRLLYERGVMVTSVPWQLSSSRGRAEQARDEPIVGRLGGPEAR